MARRPLPTPTSTIVLLPGPDWDGWGERYARRGYDVREPAPADVDRLLRGLEQPPIVMGPQDAVLAALDAGRCAAGVALVRTPFRARGRAGLLRLRCTPGRPGWERAADRALSWAAEAADR